jgi:sulfonate dioxygenase
MAPSATETTTLPSHPVTLTTNSGPYKELAPIGFEKDVELEGKDGFEAAKA